MQGVALSLEAWICAEDSWATVSDRFGPYLGVSETLEQQSQRWCQVQQPNSVLTTLATCRRKGEPLTFELALQNGPVPASTIKLPRISMTGPGLVMPPVEPELRLMTNMVSRTCLGEFTCITSFVQDSGCFNSTCRFLPPQADLRKATLTLNLACSNFDREGQFVEDVFMCLVPNCPAEHGPQFR
jgi:hypothetical protein